MSGRRLRICVENWPGCYEGGHDPSCCRFPKSCSCTVYDEGRIKEEDLEPIVVHVPTTFDEQGYAIDSAPVVMHGGGGGGGRLPDEDPTLKGILAELGRIADGLERLAPGVRCAERKDGHDCGLRDRHVGYHVTPDGKMHWLDDE